jgi:hypothetical protein
MKWPYDGQEISITLELVSEAPSFVHSDKFHYIEMNGKRVKMVAKTNKDEFFADLTLQVSYVASKGFTIQDFFDAILYASIEHINKFNRIFLADLWSYINTCMFILEATKGQFHNLYDKDEDAINLRTTLEANARHSLRKQLLLGKESPIPVDPTAYILGPGK